MASWPELIEKAMCVAPFFVTVIDGWPPLIFARGQISRILLWLRGRLGGRDKNLCLGELSQSQHEKLINFNAQRTGQMEGD